MRFVSAGKTKLEMKGHVKESLKTNLILRRKQQCPDQLSLILIASQVKIQTLGKKAQGKCWPE